MVKKLSNSPPPTRVHYYLLHIMPFLLLLIMLFVRSPQLIDQGTRNVGLVLWQDINYSLQPVNDDVVSIVNNTLLRNQLRAKSQSVDYVIMQLYQYMEQSENVKAQAEVSGIHNEDLLIRAFTLYQLPTNSVNQRLRNTQINLILDMVSSLTPGLSDVDLLRAASIWKVDQSQSLSYFYAALENSNWIYPEMSMAVAHAVSLQLRDAGLVDDAVQSLKLATELGSTSSEKRPVLSKPIRTLILADSYRQFSVLLQQRGQFEEARAGFIRASELRPDDFWNYLSLALISDFLHASPSVIESYFLKAIEVSSFQPSKWPYVRAANYFRQKGQTNRWQYYCAITPASFRSDPDWLNVCQ